MNLEFAFLIALGIISLIYLITLFYKPTVFQYILKGLLIPLILIVYLTGAKIILLPIVLALVFAWIGDVLLIKISNLLCFRLGLASFLIGHICYIIAMFSYNQPFHVPVLVISAAVAAVLGIIIYKMVKPSKEMKIPVITYEVIILSMALSAIQLFLQQDPAASFPPEMSSTFGILVLAGSVSFVASDTSLAFVTFQKKPYYVFCMATYIAAQLLITLGFCQAV